jgi:cell division protein FtsL
MRAAAVPADRPRRTAGSARPLTAAPGPRRISGPASREGASRPVRRRAGEQVGLAYGLLASLESLPRRLPLGGRTWIALVAFALIGIVTLQLGLLKLNAGIGRAIEHQALLQRENAALSIENSELAASDRITAQATRLGMQFAPADALRFLRAPTAGEAARAAAALSADAQAAGSGSGTTQATGSSSSAPPQVSTGAPVESSGTPASGESSRSAATPGSAEVSPAPSAASSSGEPSRPGAEAVRSTGESTSSSATVPQSATAGAGGGPAAEAPGGGTQAGSSG